MSILTFQSPIQAETVTGAGLSMTDLTGAPVLLIQGDVSAGLPEGLPLPDSPGKLLAHGGLLLGRLTPGEVLRTWPMRESRSPASCVATTAFDAILRWATYLPSASRRREPETPHRAKAIAPSRARSIAADRASTLQPSPARKRGRHHRRRPT